MTFDIWLSQNKDQPNYSILRNMSFHVKMVYEFCDQVIKQLDGTLKGKLNRAK